MAAEDALYSILTGDAGVSALVSTRIYPNTIPQDVTLPAVAYQKITTERDYNQAGQSQIAGPYIQITIEAASYASALSVAAAIRTALSGYKGTVGSTEVKGIFLENEYDGYDLDTDITTVRQDYRIYWKEV